jgi:hypothetical protein
MINPVIISISNQSTIFSSEFYISITSNTALGYRTMNNFSKTAIISNQSVSTTLSSTEITASGLGLIFSEEYLIKNNQNYLNLIANRYLFSVRNSDPHINLSKSTFGGLKFQDTRSGGNPTLISAELGGSYELAVSVNESVSYEDQIDNLSVSCSFWPVLVYNGYINFMSPNQIPSNMLIYDSDSKTFNSVISIPISLEWTVGNESISRSFESDTQSYFALCIITVRDLDGGSDMFYMIFNIWKSIPDLENNTPILLTFVILAIAVFILNRKDKIKSNLNFNESDYLT